MLQDPDLLALQEVRSKIDAAWNAWQKYRTFSQQQIDSVVERVAEHARAHSRRLAELAVNETTYGKASDKHIKNMLAADVLPRRMRGLRTVGIVRDDAANKVVEIAQPMGVVAAILPTTNPTSTAIYKTLIALKAGNGIVLSPHPRAKRCTCETAAILAHAATEAGAPEGLVQCLGHATLEGTNELMKHKRTAVILSTGGSGIVRAAYSSGKPAFGVGPGNVPVLIDVSAEVANAVARVVAGKSFDYGTLCSSEQTIVAEHSLRDPILNELKKQKAFLCSAEQAVALQKVLLLPPKWAVSPECVGQSPQKIAKMAGFSVPEDSTILVAEIQGVGREHPLSAEKLSPVLSLFFVKDWAGALCASEAILRFGGLGHTCVIHAKDDARVREFAQRMPAMRILSNSSSPQGSTGITTNLFPAMTLGCGAIAGNITGDNISPLHLFNVKRLAYEVRKPEDAFDPNNATVSDTVSAAVDRWLAKRGGAEAPAAAKGQSAPTTASIVDRFLENKKPGLSTNTVSAPACACDLPATPAPPSAAVAPEPPSRPEPEKPAVTIVDFVCENDVRAAMNKGQKIFVGPKTIITPSARDLGNANDILVVAQRS